MPVKPLTITGIIAAGGSGQRLGVAGGKQLLEIAGRPVAAYATDALAASALIQDIVVVCDPDRLEEYVQLITASVQTDKPLHFVAGGDTREDSVYAGLLAASGDVVAIHDGARPLLEPADADKVIGKLVDANDEHLSGTVLGIPAVDTLKQVKTAAICKHQVTDTPDRSLYWHAQTPQVFWREELIVAYDSARQEGWQQGTDDASYLEHQGAVIAMIKGSRNNIKITTPEDVVFVEALLDSKGLQAAV